MKDSVLCCIFAFGYLGDKVINLHSVTVMKERSILKFFLLAIAASLFCIGCKSGHNQGFDTYSVAGQRSFLLVSKNGHFPFAGDTIGLVNSFNLVWPCPGKMTSEAEHELLVRYFGDTEAKDIDQVASVWLDDVSIYDEDEVRIVKVDTLPDTMEYSYSKIEGTCSSDGVVACFMIGKSNYEVGSAHMLYTAEYVNVDVRSGNVIHLSDLVDTTVLGEVLYRAVNGLEVNKSVRESLFDEYVQSEVLPLSNDFIIDGAGRTITVNYQVYDIAPYAYGIQSVVLPLDWLFGQVTVTDYARSLMEEMKGDESL